MEPNDNKESQSDSEQKSPRDSSEQKPSRSSRRGPKPPSWSERSGRPTRRERPRPHKDKDSSTGRDERGPRRDDRGGPRSNDRGPRRHGRGPRRDDRGGPRGQDRGRSGGGYRDRNDRDKRSNSGYTGKGDRSTRRVDGGVRRPGPHKPRRARDENTPHYRARDKRRESSDRTLKLVATCALGLELIVGREIEALGMGPIERTNANVSFPYSPSNLARANYWLRSADRVWLQLSEFSCRDFEDLFQGLKEIDWGDMLPQDANFPVEVISTKSKLESVPSCQSVAKKAVVDKMRQTHGRAHFPESGARFAIRVFIVYDRAKVFIDSSGEGLHRRGYRTYNAKAPLRETVAAALVLLSHWSPERELYDPMCGSGTILLEAACIGLKKAAGLERSFAAQRWNFLGKECWEEAYTEAQDLYERRLHLRIYGSDNDGDALKLAAEHLKQSGFEGRGIHFQNRDVKDFSSKRKYGVLITNPPYGHRLSSEEEVIELTKTMGEVFRDLHETWSLYFYSALHDFSTYYGMRSERVRKIYNGRIEANYFQYPGPKPPRRSPVDDEGKTREIKRIPLKP